MTKEGCNKKKESYSEKTKEGCSEKTKKKKKVAVRGNSETADRVRRKRKLH